MDPGRRAMIADERAPRHRDPISPRFDPKSRITKATKRQPSPPAQGKAKYLTQDEQSRQFVDDEDKFVLKQAKRKADIRVREHRAKPIDYLAFNLRCLDAERDVFDDEEADADIEIPRPTDIVLGLSSAGLAELEGDIASYHVLETDARNRQYWAALKTLCADRKSKLDPRGHEGRVVNSVADDIDKILSPKTFEQLEALEKQIKAKLRSDEDIDTDYWEQLSRSVRVWKAKATLKRIQEQVIESRPKSTDKSTSAATSSIVTDNTNSDSTRPDVMEVVASRPTKDMGMAPPPGTARFSHFTDEDSSQATNALYDREVARGVSENEEVFTAEEAVPSGAKPNWTDKYRARKPRSFNRVQMGYEWNKYNQTHYDHDNPPPKVVHGYKFNVFYPELIDKTKAPTFKIIREHGRRRGESFAAAGEEDTCLIRFMAGPPYEDIAFRIVDREWDYSAKRERGFRSSFDKVCGDVP